MYSFKSFMSYLFLSAINVDRTFMHFWKFQNFCNLKIFLGFSFIALSVINLHWLFKAKSILKKEELLLL